MKKRLAAICALALEGILSGCGQKQAQEQPADNTICIAPAAQETAAVRAGTMVEYRFSGNSTEANGIEFNYYTWDGSAWKNSDWQIGAYGAELNQGEGKITFQRADEAVNAVYDVEVTFPSGSAATQYGDPTELSKLPTENLTAAVAAREDEISDLAVDTELPIFMRVFYQDETPEEVTINAFSDPESSEALQKSSYAEAYTVKFVKKDNL